MYFACRLLFELQQRSYVPVTFEKQQQKVNIENQINQNILTLFVVLPWILYP